ncbi:hypothetical protein PPACK8108_LOCUS17298 [Phakopsora pachyrhizi]|uniref:Uncharacterized protein n=1 Tax=Phakopsora pachyrhizi TaxID=170000 RepID=A0AAV0BAP0_PHAPC|nr:hypothetical protein PPACK8108_LOCUS17298 [Phakopsora pachyrhizi]
MTPLENNTHLSSAPFPHPTVSFLRPISSPPTFLNTNTGFITEHNEMEQDDNSNVNTSFKKQRGTSVTNNFFTTDFSILLHLVSVNHQLANPNLKNYQGGTLTNYSKEAFLKNITVANRHLCLVIDNPSLPSYIEVKVKEAIDLLRADEESMVSFFPGVKFCKT